MTHLVEDGTGIYGATSYVGLGFVHSYLHTRGLETAWDAATEDAREAATVLATDYIDRRFGSRFLGSKEFLDIAVPSLNILDILSSPQNNSTITIGTTVYKFVNALVDAYDVAIGASAEEAAANLILAITAGPGEGTNYGTGTLVPSRILFDPHGSGRAIPKPLHEHQSEQATTRRGSRRTPGNPPSRPRS